jgi:hypothetical protein
MDSYGMHQIDQNMYPGNGYQQIMQNVFCVIC